MRYTVGNVRQSGLEAKWTKTRLGKPCIVARDPQSNDKAWYMVTNEIWALAEKVGLREAFDNHTMLGQFFSIPI